MAAESNADALTYFVTVVGLYGVGKTSIITKLKKNTFKKSYTPSQEKKIIKHTLTQKVGDLDKTIKLSFRDDAGFSSAQPSDKTFLKRKAHILCCVYVHVFFSKIFVYTFMCFFQI